MPATLPPLAEHALELFEGLGHIRIRRMFGGYGFYADELFFALIADDQLYLKADTQTETHFRQAGSAPFTYDARDGRRVTLQYWSAPEEAFDSPTGMRDWARLALAAALRARALHPPAKRRTRKTAD